MALLESDEGDDGRGDAATFALLEFSSGRTVAGILSSPPSRDRLLLGHGVS